MIQLLGGNLAKTRTMSKPLTPAELFQREFLPMRGKLLEVAAALDRLERKAPLLLDYPGMDQIAKAIEALSQNGQARAETVQKIFSLTYNPDWNTDISGTDG